MTTTAPIPLGETRSLKLQCKTGNYSPSTYMLRDIAPVKIDRDTSPASVMPNDGKNFWTGNGSLISLGGTAQYPVDSDIGAGYGRTIDVATYSGLNRDIGTKYDSMVFFQVYRRASTVIGKTCSKVQVTGALMNGISWKVWNSSSMISGQSVTASTYTVNLPTSQNWYVIGVTLSASSLSQNVKAVCLD